MSVKPHLPAERSEFDEDERPMCLALRKHDIILLKDRPCEVVEISGCGLGKPGFKKVHMVGLDVFTGKKYEDMLSQNTRLDYPVVTRQGYTLVDIQPDGFLTLMSDDGELREDLKLPEGGAVGKAIKKEFSAGKELLCTVLKANVEEGVIAWKDNAVSDK